MPWRNLINKKLKTYTTTYTTTDMSDEYLNQLKADGWREASDLEWRIANAIEGYDPEKAAQVLLGLIHWSHQDK